jgi:hypothetical protein
MLITDRNFSTSFYDPAGGYFIGFSLHFIKIIKKTLLFVLKIQTYVRKNKFFKK